jgi:hypothetical protein
MWSRVGASMTSTVEFENKIIIIIQELKMLKYNNKK